MPDLRWLNIPAELRQCPQWAVATLEPIKDRDGNQVIYKGKPKLDKAPRNPTTGRMISVHDRAGFVDFYTAINSGYPAIGFILTAEDPFVVIDLDQNDATTEEDQKVQQQVLDMFQSYTEVSVSGAGLHIIMHGTVSGGFNRGGIELYDQERFILCTGNVHRALPLGRNDEGLLQLASEMGYRGRAELPPSQPEPCSDEEILRKLSTARNSDKFKDLFNRPCGPGDDWSQRDAALAQMIAFHTRNHEQAIRIFSRSVLWRPDSKGKSPEHYVEYYLLGRTFARAWRAEMKRDADIEHGEKLAKGLLKHSAENRPVETIYYFPPGLVGEVAEYIMRAAQRPVPEIALAGAITFCSGLLGRQYNISRSGLNLYTVLVAPTGRGKEAAATGIAALMSQLRTEIPIITQYQGPGFIASGQGLIKALDEQPSMFSFLSEFGHTLQIVTSTRANAADMRTRQVLLDLFSKSGKDGYLAATAYSDKEKNTKGVQAPCFAFMGDTTPDLYFEQFSSTLLAEGLLPRFLTISYDGPRVAANKSPTTIPKPELVEKIKSIVTSLANMAANNTFVDVATTIEAQAMLDAFDAECDNKINYAGSSMADAEIWNRAHLKVLRLAALVAVGRNHFNPTVEPADVKWAIGIVTSEVKRVVQKHEEGEIGDLEGRQMPEIIRATRDWMKMTPVKRAAYLSPGARAAEHSAIVPYSFYRRRFRNVTAFTKDRLGAQVATKKALQDAVDQGVLEKLTEQQKSEVGLARMTGDVFTPGVVFPAF